MREKGRKRGRESFPRVRRQTTPTDCARKRLPTLPTPFSPRPLFHLLVVALLVARMAIGLNGAIADELPEDSNKIESLTSAQAKALAEFKGKELAVNGLTTLDAATAKSLAEFKGQWLYLNGLTTLDAATAKALAEFKGGFLHLNGLTTLDVATAKGFAEFNGGLVLNGLTTLDAATAKAVAEFKGRGLRLYLYGLTALDAATAKALAEFEGTLILPNLTAPALTPDTASTWAAFFKGNLSFVTALDSPDSVAIAQALATRKGRLKLPNLEKISPKTLTALIQKEDVEIPLIETLELIPEPDGSVTEDFLIPERLVERQDKQRRQRATRAAE